MLIWLQPEPVVHPEDRVLREELVHELIQLDRAVQVGAERLLHHDPVALGPARGRDALGDPAEQQRRHLQVEQDLLAIADRIRHGVIGGVVVEVAVHVPEQAEHLAGRVAARVDVVPLERRDRVVAELVQAPAVLGYTDHRHVQHPALHQPDQRRERFQLGQVAGGAEDDQCVNLLCCHLSSLAAQC
jgi:hypothetical protein